jgi:hypothetical protein
VQLGISAERAIAPLRQLWRDIARNQAAQPDSEAHPLGWMRTYHYFETAYTSMQANALEPVRARSIPVRWFEGLGRAR